MYELFCMYVDLLIWVMLLVVFVILYDVVFQCLSYELWIELEMVFLDMFVFFLIELELLEEVFQYFDEVLLL